MSNETTKTEITVGTAVRSYDFIESTDQCYFEGVVTAIGPVAEMMDGLARYTIVVTRQVWEGETVAFSTPKVFPPVNGTPKFFDQVDGPKMDGVRAIVPAERTVESFGL